MRLLYYCLLLFAFAICSNAPADEDDRASDNDTTSGKVYECLADFSLAIEDIEKTRHAFVGRGEYLVLGGPELVRKEIIWAGVRIGPLHNLHARCRVDENSQGRALEMWSQRLIDGGAVAYRYGLPSRERIREMEGKDDDEKTKRARLARTNFADVFPLGIAAGFPNSVLFGFPINRTWLGEHLMSGRLEIGKYNEDGDIFSVWITNEVEDRSRFRKTTITFGKAAGWMPIRCKVERKHAGIKELENLGETITEYEKYGKRYLPKRCEAMVPKGRIARVVNLDFRWKTGTELKKSLVDKNLDNWLEPVRILFGETWQRKGFIAPFVVDLDREDQ